MKLNVTTTTQQSKQHNRNEATAQHKQNCMHRLQVGAARLAELLP